MAKVKCSAQDCVHLKDNICKKSLILINGFKARKAHDTACNSYLKNRLERGEVEFASPFINENDVNTSIYCSAASCSHNNDGECRKNNVSVYGKLNNTTDTTMCESFEKC